MSYNERTIADDLKAIQQSAAGRMLNNFLKGLKQPAMVEMTPAQKLLYERRFGRAPQPVAPRTETAQAPSKNNSVTNAFGTQYDMSDPAQVAALNREIEEHKRGRLQAIDQKIAESKIKPDAPVPPTAPTAPVYNAEQQVKKHGVKKAEDLAMMEWAKAHKKLAEKVKPGQAGYDAIQLALGKTTVEPEDIRGFMDDTGKSAEEARAILGGGSVETVIDGNKPMVTTINQPTNKKGAEAFKNFAIGALQGIDIGKYKDLGENPFKIKPGQLLDQSVDFNIPGLAGTLGNYGTADYGELLKKYPNIFSYK